MKVPFTVEFEIEAVTPSEVGVRAYHWLKEKGILSDGWVKTLKINGVDIKKLKTENEKK